MKMTFDVRYEIWDDEFGNRVEVGTDSDGLDLVEIRSISSDGGAADVVSMPEEAVPLLIEALQRTLAFREERRRESSPGPAAEETKA